MQIGSNNLLQRREPLIAKEESENALYDDPNEHEQLAPMREIMDQLRSALRIFFEDYARLFQEDINKFCNLYHFPSTTVRLDGTVQLFNSKEEALRFFNRAKQKYESEGCARWGIRSIAVEQLGAGSAVATIDWDMLKTDHSKIRGWRQTYNVIGAPGHWKVLHSTLHMGSELSYHNGA